MYNINFSRNTVTLLQPSKPGDVETGKAPEVQVDKASGMANINNVATSQEINSHGPLKGLAICLENETSPNIDADDEVSGPQDGATPEDAAPGIKEDHTPGYKSLPPKTESAESRFATELVECPEQELTVESCGLAYDKYSSPCGIHVDSSQVNNDSGSYEEVSASCSMIALETNNNEPQTTVATSFCGGHGSTEGEFLLSNDENKKF